ncbi:16S rRNA (uracil(1498)-N(3))-methyltransferase [Lentisalinibacter salinarum]|uniref:16S rRNA (uracil(1498)-N(3))-methyltransferase n=1 Tax=Lentisalinibacter salinarum TaxID=2992239 RepID=UPI00386960EA
MRTVRLHYPEPLTSGDEVTVGEDDARYLTRVLRLPVGAPLVLFDGRGGEYDATMVTAGRRVVTVAVGEHRAVERESPLAVTVAQGISRGERMDHVVQKTTELGAAAIVPLLCERGVVRLDDKRAAARLEHWQRVAVSACRQCGRNRLPQIAPITALEDWLAAPPTGLRLVLTPDAADGLTALARPTTPVTLLVGPEGGLTDRETQAAEAAGFRPVGLGPRILRTETAAVAGIAALQTLWGDLQGRTAGGDG